MDMVGREQLEAALSALGELLAARVETLGSLGVEDADARLG